MRTKCKWKDISEVIDVKQYCTYLKITNIYSFSFALFQSISGLLCNLEEFFLVEP